MGAKKSQSPVNALYPVALHSGSYFEVTCQELFGERMARMVLFLLQCCRGLKWSDGVPVLAIAAGSWREMDGWIFS